MSTVVLPVANSALTAKLERLAPAEEQITKLTKELDEAKKRATLAESVAAMAIAKTPFLPGSVYPSGADKILIGSTRNQLIETYPSGSWDEDKDYYTATTGHPHFGQITYYFMGSPNKNNVTTILFHSNHDSPLKNEEIKQRFRVLFGAPNATGKRGRTWWKATPRESIEMENEDRYLVTSSNKKPYWASP